MTITVYGSKDSGKSIQAFALPGKKFVVAFDGRSKTARDSSVHKGDPNIRVFTAYKYYNENDPASAQKTIDYVNWALEEISRTWKPDWVIFDAFDVQAEIAEAVMRANHGLSPSDSFSNKNLWKERKRVVRGLWRIGLNVARLGVVYCTYYKEKVLERDAAGEPLLTKKAPHWLDLIEHETVITVETTSTYSTIAKKHIYGAVVSCKYDNPDSLVGMIFKPGGETFDLTGEKTLPWTQRMEKFMALADAGKITNPVERAGENIAQPTPQTIAATSKPIVTITEGGEKKISSKW
jgi:hypothetical protein